MKRILSFALLAFICISINGQSKKEIKKRNASIQNAIHNSYDKYKDNKDGANADYIPVLAEVPSELFGIVVIFVSLIFFTFKALLVLGLLYITSIPVSYFLYKKTSKQLNKISKEEDHEDIL